MATNANASASKTNETKEKKPKAAPKPFMDRISEQLKKQVLLGKVSNDELNALSQRIEKFKAIGEALKA